MNEKRENEKEREVTDPMRIELGQKKKTRGGVRFVLRCVGGLSRKSKVEREG